VRESVQNALPTARAAGLELSFEAPDELWAVVDSQRMSQVVDNLVSNAIKYTQSGSVRVVLTIEDRVQIDVSDTGIGIDPDGPGAPVLPGLSFPGQSIQGGGLGLSIIESIMGSHGGRIEVQSEVGGGSRFQVRLPLDLLGRARRAPKVPLAGRSSEVRSGQEPSTVAVR
jgi:two-component system phosphate regulon sensor histidine kinase PhoR